MARFLMIHGSQDTGAKPVFPRWGAYFNVWVGLLFMPG